MVKVFWWRVAFLLFIATLEISFASILFPQNAFPGLVFNTVVALVLVLGFREASPEWLFLLFAFDILRSGTVTALLPAGVVAAYLASFVSRRFVFEHRGSGLFLLSFLGSVTALVFDVSQRLEAMLPLDWGEMTFGFFLTFVTFIPVFFLVQWFEHRLANIRQAEFRGLRH